MHGSPAAASNPQTFVTWSGVSGFRDLRDWGLGFRIRQIRVKGFCGLGSRVVRFGVSRRAVLRVFLKRIGENPCVIRTHA